MVAPEKAIVYPYDAEFAPILRHINLLKKFDIVKVISLRGWSYHDKNASHGDNGDDMPYAVSTDFEKYLESCDTVIIADTSIQLDFDEIIKPKILHAIKKKKNIISLIKTTMENNELFTQKAKENSVYYINYYNENEIYDENDLNWMRREKIPNLSTPIVFIGGLSERLNKFEIQLNLREKLLSNGYNVSQIGSRRYCEFLGFHSFPFFMFSKKFYEHQKIDLLKKYLHDIETRENPDLIIFGLPGGVIPLTDYYTNNYSVLAYEVFNAFIPDVSILSIPYEHFYEEFIKFIKDCIYSKYNVKIDCVNLSNTKISWMDTISKKTLNVSSFDFRFIDKVKSNIKSNVPIFNIFNQPDSQRIADLIVDSLSENEEMCKI